MYNPDHKTKFIETLHSATSRHNAEKIFAKTEKYERLFERDFCLFTDSELNQTMFDVLPPRAESQGIIIKMIDDYFFWSEIALSKKLPKHDLLRFDALNEKFKITMVDGPGGLEMYLNAVFPNKGGNRIDCVHRCYCWLAFMGVSEEDALKIKKSDIDFIYLDLKYKDMLLPIYREAYPDFRKAVDAIEFTTYHPLYPDKPNVRPRIPGDELLRGVKAISNIKTLRSTITHKGTDALAQGKTDKKLSYQRLRLSGLFYETYMLERRGVVPDFNSIAEEECVNKGYSGNKLWNARWKLAKSYLDDYYRWKLIFWNN